MINFNTIKVGGNLYLIVVIYFNYSLKDIYRYVYIPVYLYLPIYIYNYNKTSVKIIMCP